MPLPRPCYVSGASNRATLRAMPAFPPRIRRSPRLLLPGTALALGLAFPWAAAGTAPPRAKSTAAARPAIVREAPGVDLEKWCQGIAALDADGATKRCLSLQLADGGGRSVKGVPLWSTDIAPPTEAPGPLRVLVLGGIHADEEASVVLVMDWIERARQAGGGRPVHWRMAPLVNPDGFFVPSRTRVNSNGVDLNRNFATRQWSEEARKYWVKVTRSDPRRFPGPAPLSEPESRWVHGQIDQFQPHLIVSVHAPYGVLDFDGPPPPPNRLGNLMLDQVGIYPGSLGNYGGIVLGVPVVTLELKHSTRVTASDASAMWNDLQAWIADKFPQVPNGAARFGARRNSAPRAVN